MVVMLSGVMVGLGVVFGYLAFQQSAAAPAAAERVAPPLDESEWAARLGRPFAPRLAALGLPRASIRRDLAVIGRPTELHLAAQSATAIIGLFLPMLLSGFLAAGGQHLPLPVAGVLSFATAGLFYYAIDLSVQNQAERCREDALSDLATFLDITVNALAAGSGHEQALGGAAETGDSPAFDRLRHALDVAFLSRVPIHEVFAELGQVLDLTELRDLSASLALAGTEGAKIRASLTAKAESIRTKILADEEAAASSATERMAVPIGLLLAGFLVVLGYPALARAMFAL